MRRNERESVREKEKRVENERIQKLEKRVLSSEGEFLTCSGYSLFKVPTGAQKRTGVVTDQWAQDFHQVNKTSFASYFCMFEVLANYISTVYNYNCQTFNFLQNVYFNLFK